MKCEQNQIGGIFFPLTVPGKICSGLSRGLFVKPPLYFFLYRVKIVFWNIAELGLFKIKPRYVKVNSNPLN